MKLERAYTSSLTAHLKELDKKKQRNKKTKTKNKNKYTQEEWMAGNNQTQGWNRVSKNKENYIKNQPNQEMVLKENQQDQ